MDKGRSSYKLPPPRRRFFQYQIGMSGGLAPPESRRLLTKINTLEFPKWQQIQTDSVMNWKDVFDIEWACFGCNTANLKHAPYCHNSRSYCKRESDRSNVSKLNVIVPACLSRDDLVLLVTDEEKFCKKLHVSINIFQEQLTRHDLEFGTNCNDTSIEVSPSTNRAAQDLLLLKEPPSTVVATEMEKENTKELIIERHFVGKKSLQICDKNDDNKPASVAHNKPTSPASVPNNNFATPQSTTATAATYREKSKIGRKPTAMKTKVKITKTLATKAKVTQSGGDELIVKGGSVGAKDMKEKPKLSTRVSIRRACASIRLASGIEDHEHEQDNEQELRMVEKPAKAAMRKSAPKKIHDTVFCKKKEIVNVGDVPDVRQFLNTDLQLQEKIAICKWQQTFADEPGVISPMLNSLEMIIKFSNDIVKEKDIEVPARMTWMEGLQGGNSDDPEELSKYGLKILFVLMCSPRATDLSLKILDDFLNGPKFSLDNVSSMGIQEIADIIRPIGMQNQNASYIQQAFQKIKHGPWAGRIPNDYQILNKFDGIGMKIALLVMQYVYGIVQVSIYCFCLNVLLYLLT